MTSLNPVFTVGAQLAEPLIKHMGMSKAQAWKRAEELLAEVGIPEPARRMA
jgi:peptide/nickel transport system ATP-binding protein